MAYTLCASEQDLALAIPQLLQSEYLVLDCEGHALGMQDGALSLVSFGTAHGHHVFLIDAHTILEGGPMVLQSPAIRAFVTLIGRADVRKVMWDGRQDAVAFKTAFGADLQGVLDLQIAEIISRTNIRRENDRRRLGRLETATGGHCLIKPHLYQEMHGLMGLEGCLKQRRIGLEHVKSEAVKAMHRNDHGASWMKRPLSAQLLAYAAHDIRGIAVLYDHFRSIGWLPISGAQTLLEQSTRHVSMQVPRGPADPNDIFRKGPFLPLDILTSPSGETCKCEGCLRHLSTRHFSITSGQRSTYCRVCEAMALKARLEAKNTSGG